MSEFSTAKCYLNDRNVWWRMEADQKKTSSNLRCFYESKVQTVTNEGTITEDERDIWVGLENWWVFLLFLKIGVCFQKLEFVFENRSLFSKKEFVFENRSLLSKIGVWTSEFAFQKSEFVFENRNLLSKRRFKFVV